MRGCTLLICLGLLACGRERVEIIGAPDAGAPCPTTLGKRLTFSQVPVDSDIAWLRADYDFVPTDERIALAVQPDGQALLAWLEAGESGQAGQGVHVTPLDANLTRRGDDTLIADGLEVSGLVAHNDGFALLIRKTNPGTDVAVEGTPNTVAALVRYRNGEPAYSRELTGSAAEDGADTGTVYSPMLRGQLVWDGLVYGAYFIVRGGVGASYSTFWRDLLVFRNDFGRIESGWSSVSGCNDNHGIRLIRDAKKVNLLTDSQPNLPAVTGVCAQETQPGLKFTGNENDASISDQELGWSGYSGARLGSLIKIGDGYLVFWLSHGDAESHRSHDIRMARLDANYQLVAGPTWLTTTPDVEEGNLHVVPYGDKLLMLYNEIAIESATSRNAMYLGTFRGTHLRLLDMDGNFLSDDEMVSNAPTTADDEPVILPGGDVAWAFVNPAPDSSRTVPQLTPASLRVLHIARLRYCR